jgi:hypothetical protein
LVMISRLVLVMAARGVRMDDVIANRTDNVLTCGYATQYPPAWLEEYSGPSYSYRPHPYWQTLSCSGAKGSRDLNLHER